jgi:soluble lytic murein transglycosylase
MFSKRTIDTLLLLFFWGLISCAAQQVQPDFYQGLSSRAELRIKDAAAFFENALNSSNARVRQAAAAELASLLYAGEELSKPVLDRVRQEAAGSWAAAFEALSDPEPARVREKALAFILSSGSYSSAAAIPVSQFPDEAALYTLRECRYQNEHFFSLAENAAIEGHIAASRSRFLEALAFFRIVIDSEPHIFFRYPDLLIDLGRSFQYAAVGIEGMELFLDWEKNLAGGQIAEIRQFNDIPGIRFRLLFFAARIARQRGLVDQGITLFVRALPFAPDSDQTDACIWYILDSALSQGPVAAIQRLAVFVPQWHDDTYFFDVLDKLSRELITRRQWTALINVFALLQSRSDSAGRTETAGRASTAKYAWIIGRILAEGYLSSDEISLAAEAIMAGMGATSPAAEAAANIAALSRAYLRIAYNAGSASFYYRAQSAAALHEPFLEQPETAANPSARTGSADVRRQSAVMEFLMGFFSHGAAGFAPRYIRSLEKELSIGELRSLAEALGKAELYAESMRLVSVYMAREDYETDRRDLELWYPRPFRELVEQYAAETGLTPELLFGLIRTESAFQSDIVSRAGAIGLTQLMPATAEEMAGRIHRQGGPDYAQTENDSNAGLNLRDPATNIHIGAIYLGYLMERMENTLLTLLAYNGGLNRVRRWRTVDSRIPPGGLPADLFLETIEYPETREYGRRVMAAAAVYGELYYSFN